MYEDSPLYGPRDHRRRSSKAIDNAYLPFIRKKKAAVVPIAEAKPGNVVEFGRYYFDADGAEMKPLQWRVLDVTKDGEMLLVTEYGIDNILYDDIDVATSWEKCSMRSWLNNEFFETAFSITEQTKITMSVCTADKNPFYKTDPGNETKDRVFCMSDDETFRYWYRRWARRCLPTPYAESKGIYTFRKHCWWWTRTPGYFAYGASVVFGVGVIHHYGYRVNNEDVCVRPAIRIKVK